MQLQKKINGWDLCINDIYDAIPSMQKEADGYIQILSDMEDDLYDLESKYFIFYEENENLKKKLENSEEKLKDFEIKLQDFNIVDLYSPHIFKVKSNKRKKKINYGFPEMTVFKEVQLHIKINFFEI